MFKRWKAACAALGVVLSVAGCGGGGGDDLEIRLSQTAFTLQTEEGQPGSVTLTATVSGEYDGDIYVGAVASTDAITNVDISFDDTHAYLTAYASSELSMGTHTGRLEVLVCADANCSRQIGGSPFHVDYTVDVRPRLKATPESVTTSFVSGSMAPVTPVVVQLPDGASSFSATSSHDWLEVTGVTATGFSVRPRVGLSSGSYVADVSLVAGTRSIFVPVTFIVDAPAGGEHDLELQTPSATLVANEGGAGAASVVRFTPPTWDSQVGTETVYDAPASGWLSVTSTAEGVELVADASALSQGTYTATLRLRHVTWGANFNTYEVPVALTVGAGLVRPADRVVSVLGTTTASQLSGSAPIDMATGPARDWSATTDASWLKLDTPTGQTGNDLRFHIDLDGLAAMANGTSYAAQVTVTAQPASITPMSFQVVLDKNLPEVRSVAPFAQPAGRTNTVIVRGTGLNAVGGAGTQIVVGGLSDFASSVQNDRELRVTLSAATPAGSHAISIVNALGLAMPSKPVEVFTPQTHVFAKLPHTGVKRGVLVDPVRQSIYTVNSTSGSVLTWKKDGGNWVRQSRSLPALADIGLATDASSLVATSTSGTLYLLDPITLASKSSHVLSGGMLKPTARTGLAVTNDARVWVTQSDYWGTPYTFDLASRTFSPVPTDGLSTTFHYGPWSHASRNGERLVMTQSSSVSPSPPMLYLDAKDGVLKENPAGLTSFYQISQSDDGGRLMLHSYEVYDSDFALIGQVPATEAGYSIVAGSLSPDGRRAYMLAYSENQKQTVKPRVYVLDTSQPPAGGSMLPVVGSFDLDDYATCTDGGWETCPGTTETVVSADGRTLFVAGHTAVLVAPIPSAHQSAQGTSPATRRSLLQQRRAAAKEPAPPASPKRWVR
jgi:hypothetical protein